jgi:hypothetical protein
MVDEHLRESYYEILNHLLIRPEFYLSYMGFDKKLRDIYDQRNNPVF